MIPFSALSAGIADTFESSLNLLERDLRADPKLRLSETVTTAYIQAKLEGLPQPLSELWFYPLNECGFKERHQVPMLRVLTSLTNSTDP